MHRQSEKNLFVLSYSVIMEFGYLQISRYRTSLWNLVANFELSQFLPLEVNCVRFCFWRCLWLFLLCVKYLGNRWTDLRQIHTEDVFGPSLGRVWRSRSRSISAACVRFVFEKNIFALVFWFFAAARRPPQCCQRGSTVAHLSYWGRIVVYNTLSVTQSIAPFVFRQPILFYYCAT